MELYKDLVQEQTIKITGDWGIKTNSDTLEKLNGYISVVFLMELAVDDVL